jgi:hypothetical protein
MPPAGASAKGHKQTFTPILDRVLRSNHCKVRPARDGCEAIEFAQSHVLGGLDFIANISAYSLDPLSARGPRLEGIAEVLGLTGNLSVPELHDTHRVRRQAVVCEDEFSDPKVGNTEYTPHHKALLVRLRKTRRLNIAPTADPLPGLRVLKHCIVMVNLVLYLEIVRI